MSVLPNYQQFDGLTLNLGSLTNTLVYQGIVAPHTGKPFTEALLSGINGGICAGYFVFEYEGHLPHLHFLTRYPFNENNPDQVYDRLGIVHTVQQTTNGQKGAANVLNALARGKAAIVWADVMSLGYDYIPEAGDYWFMLPIVVYGMDMTSEMVNIADRASVPLTSTTKALDTARSKVKKLKHRMITIDSVNPDRLPQAVLEGIKSCIALYYGEGAPGLPANFGFNGFIKWADALKDTRGAKSWAKQFAPGARMFAGLTSGYRYLETWFTGGHGARGVYADFLDEAAVILQKPALNEVAEQFRVCAKLWEALTCALLPDNIAPFKQARDLIDQNYTLFLKHGSAAQPERAEVRKQLKQLEAEVAADFPLSEVEAAAMRGDLRDRVLAIHKAEQIAVTMLSDSLI